MGACLNRLIKLVLKNTHNLCLEQNDNKKAIPLYILIFLSKAGHRVPIAPGPLGPGPVLQSHFESKATTTFS